MQSEEDDDVFASGDASGFTHQSQRCRNVSDSSLYNSDCLTLSPKKSMKYDGYTEIRSTDINGYPRGRSYSDNSALGSEYSYSDYMNNNVSHESPVVSDPVKSYNCEKNESLKMQAERSVPNTEDFASEILKGTSNVYCKNNFSEC